MQAADYGERAKALSLEGDEAAAEAVLRRGLAELPGDPILGYALSTILLARADFEEGWQLYEGRRRLRGYRSPPTPNYQEWSGRPLSSLLVFSEQGLGDQIMFARYIPELVSRGIRTTLFASPKLVELFSALGATVLPASGQVQAPRHEAWCLMGSLPRLLGSLPNGPYVGGGPGGHGVGVMVRGSGNYPHRTPPPEMASELLTLGRDLHPEATGALNFAETADIIRGLDLVISVDTSVAHLAGAMGKPTWLLLASSSDWRWGSGDVTPWYPSMSLIRQPREGEWRAVIAETKRRLSQE